jgi:UDP-N-acetylmuramoyl-tripeptide--D-alanyl-D-alanine ligase
MRLGREEVAGAVGAAAAGPEAEFTSYHTNSGEVLPGGLFFALRGAETDGHRFLEDAVARGAAGVVVERDAPGLEGVAVLRVEDAWRALYDLARHVRDRVRPRVFAVTGSNGKTSTKEMLAAALAGRYRVLRTEGNLNTETGVPLTMLRLEPAHEVMVLEMGMQGPGEIARLAALAEPEVGVITGIGTVHIEFFDSQEGIARAKGELVAALPRDGLAVLPAETPFLPLLRSLTPAATVTFGAGGDYELADYRPQGDGCAFTVRGVRVHLALGGRHMATNALAALAAAEHAGVGLQAAAPELARVRVAQRLAEAPAPAGFRVVDDSYNASPESMLAAFAAVAERERPGRLLAVLGEMRELGSLAEPAHREVGERARAVFDAVCVVAGGSAGVLAEAAGAELVADRAAAAAWVRATARPGDVVLVKASHGVHLEELVAELLAT